MDGNGVSHPNKILFSQLEIRWNKPISGNVSSGCRRLQSHKNLDTLTKHRGQHHHGWSEISPLCCRSKRSLPKTGHDYSKQSLKFARCYMSGIRIYRDLILYIHLHPRSPQGCSPLQTIYPDIIFFRPRKPVQPRLHDHGLLRPPTYVCTHPQYLYLAGGWPTPLKNMSSSVGMSIPNIWKNKNHVPNHQSDMDQPPTWGAPPWGVLGQKHSLGHQTAWELNLEIFP